MLRAIPFAALVLLLVPTSQAVAQADLAGGIPSCTADWACASLAVRVPLGFYVQGVEEGGRYVVLEDGTVWEVQPDYRAAVAGWGEDDFVRVRSIAAPVGDYEYLLTKAEKAEWRAAVRLVGRRAPVYRNGGTPEAEEPPQE